MGKKNSDYLEEIDIFGYRPKHKFSKNTPYLKSYFGSFLTVTAVSLLLTFVVRDLMNVVTRAKKEISSSIYGHNLTEVGEISMDKYLSSFILTIGIENPDIDIMNNPFFQFQTAQVENDWKITKTDLALRKCTEDEHLHIYDHSEEYKNNICIGDYSNLKIQSDWNLEEEKFITPYIMVIECQNATENNNWCKSPEEIQEFMRNTMFNVQTVETTFFDNIYKDNAQYFAMQDNGEDSDKHYFPLDVHPK